MQIAGTSRRSFFAVQSSGPKHRVPDGRCSLALNAETSQSELSLADARCSSSMPAIVISAFDVHERGALLPILGRAVDLNDERSLGRPCRIALVLRENGSVVTALPNGNQFSG